MEPPDKPKPPKPGSPLVAWFDEMGEVDKRMISYLTDQIAQTSKELFEVRIKELSDKRAERVTFEYTIREIVNKVHQQDVLRAITDNLVRYVSRQIEEVMFKNPDLIEKLIVAAIKQTIKEEVQSQVRDAVKEQVEDFFGE